MTTVAIGRRTTSNDDETKKNVCQESHQENKIEIENIRIIRRLLYCCNFIRNSLRNINTEILDTGYWYKYTSYDIISYLHPFNIFESCGDNSELSQTERKSRGPPLVACSKVACSKHLCLRMAFRYHACERINFSLIARAGRTVRPPHVPENAALLLYPGPFRRPRHVKVLSQPTVRSLALCMMVTTCTT